MRKKHRSRGPEFDLESGRYHGDDGRFVSGPPKDYDPQTDRFRAQDGAFKNRSHYHNEALDQRQSRDRGRGRGRHSRDRLDRRERDRDRSGVAGFGSGSPFAGVDDDFGAADMDESPFEESSVLDTGRLSDDDFGEFGRTDGEREESDDFF